MQPLNVLNGKRISSHTCMGMSYLSMPGIMFIRVNKRGPRCVLLEQLFCAKHVFRIFLVIDNIDGLVQDYSISSALAIEILWSCNKPSIWSIVFQNFHQFTFSMTDLIVYKIHGILNLLSSEVPITIAIAVAVSTSASSRISDAKPYICCWNICAKL